MTEMTDCGLSNLFFTDVMAFCRGSKDDFDRWANITGDEGWSWESLQPFMRKVSLFSNLTNYSSTSPCRYLHSYLIPTSRWRCSLLLQITIIYLVK